MIRRPYTTVFTLLALLPWIAVLATEATWERGLLFEVRSEAGESSYLFGTIHSENDRVMDLPPPVRFAA